MIRSTFAGFNTATLAMSASQTALDVTGQNLSNINTPGYTRQRLDVVSLEPVGASSSSSVFDIKVGQGVMMTRVEQIRDPFLDVQYRNQLPKVGTSDAMDTILADIGNVFDETDKNAVASKLSDIVSQLSNMSETINSGTSSSDALVRSACEIFLDTLHQNATDIMNVQKELIQKMEESVVPDINTMLEQIRELNVSIKNSQVLGNPALELQDQRNTLIDELATYFPIDVKYTDYNMGGGIHVDELEISLKLNDGSKISLVSDNKCGSVSVEPAREKLIDPETGEEMVDPVTGEKILGEKTVPVKLFFTDSIGVKTRNCSNKLENGVLKSDMDMLNKSEAFDSPASDIKGIGYYIQSFDSFVSEFATTLNDLNAETVYKVDADGNKIQAKDANGFLLEDADGNPIYETETIRHDLFVTSDGSDSFTARNIRLNEDWVTGKIKVKTAADGETGSTANTNVLKMINALSTDKHEFKTSDGKTIFRGTLAEGYGNIWNTQAIERQASSTILKNHLSVANQIEDSRDSVSGVSMDEEAMDLMRYAQSYNAAARLMTTLDEILERLITGTGVAGR